MKNPPILKTLKLPPDHNEDYLDKRFAEVVELLPENYAVVKTWTTVANGNVFFFILAEYQTLTWPLPTTQPCDVIPLGPFGPSDTPCPPVITYDNQTGKRTPNFPEDPWKGEFIPH